MFSSTSDARIDGNHDRMLLHRDYRTQQYRRCKCIDQLAMERMVSKAQGPSKEAHWKMKLNLM